VRVGFEDVAKPRRAVQDLMGRYESVEALVLLPPPVPGASRTLDASWERDLGHEVTLVAGLVRAAAPALAVNAGTVVTVGTLPGASPEPTDLDHLVAGSCLPALHALSDAFGFRLTLVATEASGADRGTAVAAKLLEELESAAPEGGDRAGQAAGHVRASS